nr:hypothetical protein BaRGS_015307 [Batillaria attramentaria]
MADLIANYELEELATQLGTDTLTRILRGVRAQPTVAPLSNCVNRDFPIDLEFASGTISYRLVGPEVHANIQVRFRLPDDSREKGTTGRKRIRLTVALRYCGLSLKNVLMVKSADEARCGYVSRMTVVDRMWPESALRYTSHPAAEIPLFDREVNGNNLYTCRPPHTVPETWRCDMGRTGACVGVFEVRYLDMSGAWAAVTERYSFHAVPSLPELSRKPSLANLKTLTMIDTGIEFLASGVFELMSELTSLDLRENLLLYLSKDAFKGLGTSESYELTMPEFAALIFYNIYSSAMSTVKGHSKQDTVIARRLFLIVCTDLCCWFPIGLLGLLASSGIPIPGYQAEDLIRACKVVLLEREMRE